MSMTEGNLMNLLTIRNCNLPYVVQNKRYAYSGVSVLISFARVSIVSVNSPFLQSHRQRKMAARFFLRGSALALWLERRTPDRETRVRSSASSVCCFLEQDTFTPQKYW